MSQYPLVTGYKRLNFGVGTIIHGFRSTGGLLIFVQSALSSSTTDRSTDAEDEDAFCRKLWKPGPQFFRPLSHGWTFSKVDSMDRAVSEC